MTLDVGRLRIDTFSSGIPGNPGYTCSVRVLDQQTGLCAEVVGDNSREARKQALEMLESKMWEWEAKNVQSKA